MHNFLFAAQNNLLEALCSNSISVQASELKTYDVEITSLLCKRQFRFIKS